MKGQKGETGRNVETKVKKIGEDRGSLQKHLCR
jgi:hypothetical protein